MSTLVSVIIPYYNRLEYVDRAIRSVIRQTHTDWEIILVDDCSQSKYIPSNFVNSLLKGRIRTISNEINLGPGPSRQVGLENSRGSYVCFLDSDDYYAPDFIQHLLNLHIEYPQIAGAYCTSVDIQNKIIKNSDISHHNLIPDLFITNRSWTTPSWLWKKSEIGKWKDTRTNEDWLFEIDTAKINNNTAHINLPLCIIDNRTGNNTKDLVASTVSDRHRNDIALYALSSLNEFKHLKNYKEIELSVLKRIIFTSSKLAGSREWALIYMNGKMISSIDSIRSLFLILISLMIKYFPSSSIFCKKVLSKIN